MIFKALKSTTQQQSCPENFKGGKGMVKHYLPHVKNGFIDTKRKQKVEILLLLHIKYIFIIELSYYT